MGGEGEGREGRVGLGLGAFRAEREKWIAK